MASIKKREGEKTWRARYRDAEGKMHERRFARQKDAKAWARKQEEDRDKGRHVAPKLQKITLNAWCDTWLKSYRGTESTRRQARTHIAQIKRGLGARRLTSLRQVDIDTWLSDLESQGYGAPYQWALLGRLRQVIDAAIRNGYLHVNVAKDATVKVRRRDVRLVTIDQAWMLHDAMPEHMRAAVMLGAFAGLRVGEVCGLRIDDIDLDQHVVMPRVQFPAAPLKSECSRDDIPIPETMSHQIGEHIRKHSRDGLVFLNQWGDQMHPRVIERAFREAREAVRAAEAEAGVPASKRVPVDFRFHDLRHVYASFLIGSGLDVKVVQKRMRHATATLTLDTYAELWPKTDDGTRDAVGAAFVGRETPALRAV